MAFDRIRAWLERRRRYQMARARYLAFVANPYAETRSPRTRSLLGSPLFNDHVRPRGSPRRLSLSSPAKASGRDYIDDLLALERIIRWRGYGFAWRGIFSALGDNMLEVVYAGEYNKLYEELQQTCPDERLRPRRQGPSAAAVLAVAQGLVAGGRRSLGKGSQRPESRP